MSIRLVILSMLMLASVFADGFLEPDPDFFQGFWKVLPMEVEQEEKSSLMQKEPLSPLQEEVCFEVPKPSFAVWWFGAAAVIALFGVVVECIAILQQLHFTFRLNRALKHGACLQARELLQQRLAMPPGSTLTELAAKTKDSLLAARILACEKAHYMQKPEGEYCGVGSSSSRRSIVQS